MLRNFQLREFAFSYLQFLTVSGSVVKKLLANAGRLRDTGLIPVSGRSPGGGPSNPLQYSCLENLMDRGAWQAAVQRVAQNHARLSNLACMHAQCDRHPARFYVKRGVLEKQTV